MKQKLIIVDDEPDLAGYVSDVAEQAGYSTEQYHHAETFKRSYLGDADVIVLDLLLPGVDGIELIRYLAQIGSEAGVILISGFDSGVLHSAQKLAVEHGLNVLGSLSKPFRFPELNALLKNISVTREHRGKNIKNSFIPSLTEFETALHSNELITHFQPKIDLRTHNVTGLEALVRWQHPVHGILPPDLFLPIAEQNALIDELTFVVIEQVVDLYTRLRQIGHDLSIAVNMSASTLRDLALPETLNKLINEYGINPKQIVFEVTETALMQELVKSLDILTRLRMKGFQLSIDDFGTGYSSLVQLHRAPFSEIKIDRSFVLDMASDMEACAIVETVIVLGHKLGMQVVAEGVETHANLEQLTSMGCDSAQGYFIARPQSGEAITDWLENRPLQAQA
jgi:EAL domain-containing protein (putative c-di-GMP-specific phosphodiesterase class I)/FixJ family two-component response regulator